MNELNVKVGVDTSKAVNAVETIGEVKKVHPRMYEVGVIAFNDDIRWGETGKIEIPYAIKNAVVKGIEEAGFSVTILASGDIVINAIKKQLQHDT